MSKFGNLSTLVQLTLKYFLLNTYLWDILLLWLSFISTSTLFLHVTICSILDWKVDVLAWVTLCLQASVAKLETSACFVGDKLELKVYGFNDKLPVLLSKILSVARSFLPTDDRFKVSNMLFLHVHWYFKMSVLLSFLYCFIFFSFHSLLSLTNVDLSRL